MPKRYLLWTIREIFEIVNGSDIIDSCETFQDRFQKKLTFRQLYDFLKFHKEYIFNRSIPHWSCLCEICENVVMLCIGINKIIRNKEMKLPENPHDIVEKFKCDNVDDQRDCMIGDCLSCSVTDLSLSNFGGSSSESSDSDISDDVDGINTDVKYYEWKRDDDSHVKKTLVGVSKKEALVLLNQQVKILKKHIYVKRCQVKYYNELKQNLKFNEIILHVDFSENYKNQQQHEVQSAYFGHSSFALFTACCYLRSTDGNLMKESLVVVTESPDHSRITAYSCISKVVTHIREKYQELPLKLNLYVWSDGCASQFRSCYVFSLMSCYDRTLNVSWFYNERHHGKGPMDGVGGTVKNVVFRDVKSGKCTITSPEEFADFANKRLESITTLYLPQCELFVEPSEVSKAPKIAQTLQVHKVVRHFSKNGIVYLKFYYLASDEKPFFTQYYRKECDPEVCGHDGLDGADENRCGKCGEAENGLNWLCCPLCRMWFHEDCFYV